MEAHSITDSPDHNQDANDSIAHQSLTEERLLSLASRISKLEHNKHVKYNYSPKVVQKAGRFLCPDNCCEKKYVESSDLGKHCQRSHGSMGSIVSQRVCYQCANSFPTTRDLILHEKSEHGEDYVLRIEPFLRFFQLSSSKTTRYHFARDLTVTLLVAHTKPLLSPPLSESQSPPDNQPDHPPIPAQGNHLAGQSRCNDARSSCHHPQVDNLKGLPADAPLPEISQQLREGVRGAVEAFLPGIGQVRVHLAVERVNDVDLYNANRELDVDEFLSAFESENYQPYSNHPEIGQGSDTDLYQAGTHLDIDASLPGCSSNSESSNMKFASDRINDTALYNASNELDSEEFPSDPWGSNISLPPFNALQS